MLRYHQAYLPPMTHALHYGTGCFEGIRAYWNADHDQLYLLQGQAHYARLQTRPSVQQCLAYEKSVQAEFAKAA